MYLGDKITVVPAYLLSGCSSLTSISLPGSLTTIGGYAFANTGLTSVVIPNAVTTIGVDAFDGCSNLEEVTICNSVTKIGDYAFWYCSALSSVISLNPTPPTCDLRTFGNVDTSSCTLYVPEGTKDAYASADVWQDFYDIEDTEVNGIEAVGAGWQSKEVSGYYTLDG